MRKTLLVALLLAAAVGTAAGQSPDSGGGARQSDTLWFLPRDWVLERPDPHWKGRRFVSPDGQSSLAIYANPADRSTREAYLKSVTLGEGEQITYLRRGRGWLVVSGYKGDRIFYRKVLLACGNTSWRHIAFEYPAQEKRAFDRLVTRVSHLLAGGTGNQNCPKTQT